MNSYKVLNNQIFKLATFSLVPIRFEDRLDIMKWRNEQIYHLRQNTPLTKENQDIYFENVVIKLFEQEKPNQILFSFLENDNCIGYGGLVHINWIDKNAEISFIMNTELEKESFEFYWIKYLNLIEQVAFSELNLYKIYTYAFDLRPRLYSALLSSGFIEDARLKGHCFFNSKFIDVLIHSKFKSTIPSVDKDKLVLRNAEINDAELLFNWANDSSVRINSINQEPIIWENHLKWFISKLKSEATKILILQLNDCPLGQIRIDLDKEFWIIDYSIDNQFRGNGLGKEIVRLLLKNFENYKFKAIVKKENHPSIGVFNNLGFNKEQVEDLDFFYFIYNISKS
jgi:RimJ/RimL family protein N-acetyltransferase